MDAASPRSAQQLAETWSPVAAGYDEEFARFTGGYSDALLDLVGIGMDERVLDVAAGSGAFTLRAARLGASVVATDFAPGMVAFLTQVVEREGLDRVSTAVMDGQALDLPDDTFDLSVSMFGVIFFPDMAQGLSELVRVTRPGGRVGVSTWDLGGFRLVELVQLAFTRVLPDFEASSEQPAWARLGDADGLRAALEAAGLDPVQVHLVTQQWRWDDPAEFFRRMPQWSPPVQPLFAAMDPATIDAAAAAFVELVADLDGPPNAVDVSALLGIGTVG